MQNEIIFIATTLIDLAFIVFMSRFGRTGLTVSIVVNAVLISTFGAKLISLFGFVTNTGNVFYACIFAAAMILSQYHGTREAYKSIWVAFFGIVLFVVFGQFVIRSVGIADTENVHQAMQTLFSLVPRIAVASMLAYLVSQHLNVWLFDYLRHDRWAYVLWFRVIASALVGQVVDSIIFFSVAFLGTIPLSLVLQTILVGLSAKVFVAVVSIPFIRWAFHFQKSELSVAR